MAGLVEKLASTVPGWGVRLVYGDKVDLGGTEVVPVALAAFGFGGGSGEGTGPDNDGSGTGEGGGGGGYAIPVGAYVATDTGPEFRPNPLAVMVVAIPLACVVGRVLVRLIRVSR